VYFVRHTVKKKVVGVFIAFSMPVFRWFEFKGVVVERDIILVGV
jgi:hypothetical protein